MDHISLHIHHASCETAPQMPSDLAKLDVYPQIDHLSKCITVPQYSELYQVVEGLTEGLLGNPFLTSPTLEDPDNRYFSSGGGAHLQGHSPGQVVCTRGHTVGQHSGSE